ncbi:hypothetical protein [Nocardia neocaledoniensis]|nr:hypothetical protein [Nocardia neocaledoniensis]
MIRGWGAITRRDELRGRCWTCYTSAVVLKFGEDKIEDEAGALV